MLKIVVICDICGQRGAPIPTPPTAGNSPPTRYKCKSGHEWNEGLVWNSPAAPSVTAGGISPYVVIHLGS